MTQAAVSPRKKRGRVEEESSEEESSDEDQPCSSIKFPDTYLDKKHKCGFCGETFPKKKYCEIHLLWKHPFKAAELMEKMGKTENLTLQLFPPETVDREVQCNLLLSPEKCPDSGLGNPNLHIANDVQEQLDVPSNRFNYSGLSFKDVDPELMAKVRQALQQPFQPPNPALSHCSATLSERVVESSIQDHKTTVLIPSGTPGEPETQSDFGTDETPAVPVSLATQIPPLVPATSSRPGTPNPSVFAPNRAGSVQFAQEKHHNFRCSICSAEFFALGDYQKHTVVMHCAKAIADRVWECVECGAKEGSCEQIWMHFKKAHEFAILNFRSS